MEKFNFIKNGDWGDYLLIESDKIIETVNYIKENNVRNIELNSQYGYKIKNISFLVELKDYIYGLNVIDGDIDLSGLEHLINLKRLNISDEGCLSIDFVNFKYLERCSVLWHRNITFNFNSNNLKELVIKKCNFNDKANLKQINSLLNIEKLSLIQCKFEDIEFLEFLKRLVEIEVYYTPKLKDIQGLRFCSKTLNKVVFDNCKSIVDYKILSCLHKLNYLEISDSGKIESLNFIKEIKTLKHFSFVGTDVLDGNISYCLGIDYIGFNNKKKYTHKMEDFNKFNL